MMTISKDKQLVLPVWFVSVLISVIITGFTTWGIISAKGSALEVRATHSENNIKDLQNSKVSRDEFNLVREQLNRIEKKLDEHTEDTK